MSGFRHGLNTSIPETMIAITELSECVNFKNIRTGKVKGCLVSRDPIVPHTTSATTSNAAIVAFEKASLGGTYYEIIADDNGVLYYNDDGTPIEITGALESGSVWLTPYMGAMMVFDGGYIKYIDDVSGVKIAYDGGTGTSGYQFDNESGTDDSAIELGNGTNNRVAYKFTSQAWTGGYTIPPTTAAVYLSKNGTPHASSITVRLRLVSDSSVLAEKELLSDATDLTTTATKYSATFTTVATEMLPSTAYYLSVEHTGGDSSNYVKVHATTVSSGGTAYAYSGSWANTSTLTPLMSLQPGRPPKADYGIVHSGRLWTFSKTVEPGNVTFSNRTFLDYSTNGNAGSIGAVDDNENSFPVGAMASIFGELYIYGTENQPYLAKLTGTTPSDYAIVQIYQKAWSTQKTLVVTANDVWSGSGDGIDSLSGTDTYGDVRMTSSSDPVADRIEEYWDSDTAIAGYCPKDGQYLLCMPSYHRLIVAHTKNPMSEPNANGLTRYPWTEYELYLYDLTDTDYYGFTLVSGSVYRVEAADGGDPLITTCPDAIVMDGRRLTKSSSYAALDDHYWWYGDNDSLGYDTIYFKDSSGNPNTTEISLKTVIIPTCLSSFDNDFFVCSGSGFVYKLDGTKYKDQDSVQIIPSMSTGQIETQFSEINLMEFQPSVGSYGGGVLTAEIYKNNINATEHLSFDMVIDVSDEIIVDDARMEVRDALFLVDRQTAYSLSRDININCRSFKTRLKIWTAGWKSAINGIYIKYRVMMS